MTDNAHCGSLDSVSGRGYRASDFNTRWNLFQNISCPIGWNLSGLKERVIYSIYTQGAREWGAASCWFPVASPKPQVDCRTSITKTLGVDLAAFTTPNTISA